MRGNDQLPSVERLHELLEYDPATGGFIRKIDRGNKAAGSVAGCLDSKGYWMICVDYTQLRAHRVAWAMHHGEWPDLEVDHKNGVGTDNRIDNLRLATHKQNHENRSFDSRSSSGIRGVSFDKARGKWRSQIEHHGRVIRARHETLLDAVAVRLRLERALYTHHREA